LRGLDSAIIDLQSSDNPKKYMDIVRYGCLHNTTYDMQCKGDRSWYLYYAAQLAWVKEIIEAAVIQICTKASGTLKNYMRLLRKGKSMGYTYVF